MKFDNMFQVVFAIFCLLLMMLGLQGLAGQGASWTLIAQDVAPFIVLISVIGFVMMVVWSRD